MARFFNDFDTAAFTSSQWKVRDRDDVPFPCEGGDYFEATMGTRRLGLLLLSKPIRFANGLD